MDNSAENEWSMPAAAAIALVVLGLIFFGVLAVTDIDPVGYVLFFLAGLVAVGRGAYGLRARPRLAATPHELIVTGLRQRTFARADVLDVVVGSTRRLGRSGVQLEIEVRLAADDPDATTLLPFGRWDLGTAPADVGAALERLGYPLRRR